MSDKNNSIQFITFYLPGHCRCDYKLVKLKYMKITDSRETPTKVQIEPLAWEPPGSTIPIKNGLNCTHPVYKLC